MNKARPVLVNLAVLVGSLLFPFLVAELATRLLNDRITDRNFHMILIGKDLLRSAYPTVFDSELGWIPKPGASGRENFWGTKVTILDDGIRSNGVPPPLEEKQPLIIAVGDSYTFGDEVSDSETWPALLERDVGRRVLNGGVFGYGLDQSFLRAVKLLKIHPAGILIVGVIPDDIARCQLDMRTGAFKPYFEVVRVSDREQRLQLRNVPVPSPPSKNSILLNALRASHFINFLMLRIDPRGWIEGTFGESHEAHQDPFGVSKAILSQLDELAEQRHMKVLLLVQHIPTLDPIEHRVIRQLLSSVQFQHLEVMDLYPLLVEVRANDPARYQRFFTKAGGHMSAEGNGFVARELARKLFPREGGG